MRRFLLVGELLVGGVLVSGIPAPGLAQQPLPATTVQLPTVSQFSVQTTVSVPDGGTMNLGGLHSGMDGRRTRGIGPLGTRGIGGGRTASGVSVSTRVIDHAEIDRAVLAAAAADRSTPATLASAKAAGISNVTQAQTPAPASLASIRQANAAAAEREAAEVADLFVKAQAAETAGKTGVAKVYYQMVARRDRGQLKSQAEQRLASLK